MFFAHSLLILGHTATCVIIDSCKQKLTIVGKNKTRNIIFQDIIANKTKSPKLMQKTSKRICRAVEFILKFTFASGSRNQFG